MSGSGAKERDFARRVAIALEYDFAGAPRVTAKGRGHVAEAILKIARESGVAIEENHAWPRPCPASTSTRKSPRLSTAPWRRS